jgi:hypothetical protein
MFADGFRGKLRREAGFALALVFLSFTAGTRAAPATGEPAAPSAPSESDRIQPEELAGALKSDKGSRPVLLQVGFRVLYAQAHVPGSEYAGPASKPEGLAELRKRVDSLPRAQRIVLYCGCCPWTKCPNIAPAFQELRRMGFSDVKVLYIADNFGRDWVGRGYPTAKGE